MGADRYDIVIVGGGSAGCALANRLSADPGTSVLVLEAGRSDYRIDPFIHMPAALPIPIGNRLYDWKYETDPEPHMNGRRVFHARGKVLGGSVEHQRDDLPARQPDGLRALGRRARDEGVGLPPLPALLQADGELPRRRRRLARRRRPARSSSAARPTNPLFERVLPGRAGGRLPADRRRQRLPPGGLRQVRPQRLPRPPALRRPRLPAPGPRPEEPHRRDAGARHPGALPGQARGRRRLPARRSAAPHRRRRPGRSSAAARSTPRSCSSSPASATSRCSGRTASTSSHHLPGVGENLQDHLEVYIQYASKQPVSIAPGPALAGPAQDRLRLAVPPPRARRHQPLRGRRLRPQQRGRRLPEPDVPLPPGRDPVRRVRADQGPRLPGAHRPDVRRHPRLGADPLDGTRRCTRRCSSTTCRPRPTAGVGRGDPGRPRHPQPAGVRAVQRRRAVAGPAVETDEQILDWVRADAETALHPSCTAKMGVDEMSVVDPSTMGVHGLEGLRVVDASVFPFVTNGNIYAPVMMVAEKAADLIAGNTPAPGGRRAVLPPPRRHPPLPARRQPQHGGPVMTTTSRHPATSTASIGAAGGPRRRALEDLRPQGRQDHGQRGRRSSPARTSRRRPATWSASATCPSTSRPARCSS